MIDMGAFLLLLSLFCFHLGIVSYCSGWRTWEPVGWFAAGTVIAVLVFATAYYRDGAILTWLP